MEALFNLAGFTMMMHILCSLSLLAKLHDEPLSSELFALPDTWHGPRPRWLGLRLLRAKFLLLWVPAPPAMSEYSFATRAVFFLARVSGAAFPLAVLAFLAGIFVFASR